MMLQKQDLRLLRLPIVATVILIGVGVAALVASERFLDAARKEQTQAAKQRVAAQEKVSKASEEERDIRNQLVYFEQMRKAGLVGTRNRLDLIETISNIKTQRKLIDIKYNIEPQKPVDIPRIVQTGAMDFVTSRMQLDMRLLHEEDLLNFFKDLQAVGQALVLIRRCKLNRMERAGGPGLSPGLQAECTVDIINLTEVPKS